MAVYKVEVSSCQEVWIEVAITPMLMWMTSGTGLQQGWAKLWTDPIVLRMVREIGG